MAELRIEHRSGKNDWETPPEIFDPLNEEFGFTLDVCASKENTKCKEYISEDIDGLKQSWDFRNGVMTDIGYTKLEEPSVCWMNPPYNNWQQWVAKASEEAQKGATVVALLPARTDTKAFHQYIWDQEANFPRMNVQLRFIKGRITFVGAPAPAPFPSMVVIFTPPATSGLVSYLDKNAEKE